MFYIGVDLGQRVDHTALAVVEKIEWQRPYGPAQFEALHVRHVERLPLGMPYPAVVKYVKEVVHSPDLAGKCGLVVDATGVGAPVVEMLRGANLGCELRAVTITGGDKETQGSHGSWNVPKRDLISGLQLLLEKDELHVARHLREVGALVEELMDVRTMRQESGRWGAGADGHGQHDDLVIAVALACWRGKNVVKPGVYGTVRLF